MSSLVIHFYCTKCGIHKMATICCTAHTRTAQLIRRYVFNGGHQRYCVLTPEQKMKIIHSFFKIFFIHSLIFSIKKLNCQTCPLSPSTTTTNHKLLNVANIINIFNTFNIVDTFDTGNIFNVPQHPLIHRINFNFDTPITFAYQFH